MKKEEFNKYVLKTYNQEDVFFTKGEGVFLFDDAGNKWLDMISGLGAVNLGHCHPRLTKTLTEQSKNLWHTSNLYFIKPQALAAKMISKLSFSGKTFFCNSGAEANEAALKLAIKRGKSFSPKKNKIVSLKDSFHGRTIGSLSLTGQEVYQKNFTPLLKNFEYIKANDIDELESAIDETTTALFIEVIQGEGGVIPLNQEYVEKARELCNKYDCLLIIDEIQTGIFRTSLPFAYQNFNIEPDIITISKSLGNGIPIGAMHVKDKFAVLKPGDHASTFGGNFLVTSVANEVLNIIGTDDFQKRASENSVYLYEKLMSLKNTYSKIITNIRGLGFMWGIVTEKAGDIYKNLFNEKILCTNIRNKVIRILPPVIIEKTEIDTFISKLEKSIKSL